ncbi:MAG: protease pro-enzyme activation domain-containing protein [Thaumarchaeota archaeon]|nr:protease pro-enzyme activation domain-containing protein [Nitrososphaerota archaeon]
MILLPREGYRSISLVAVIISLLGLSLVLAIPTHAALGATPVSPASPISATIPVVPTLLTGYRPMGPLSPSTPVTVTIGIPLQNGQSLQYLTEQISTPGSPMYHQFLSQAQIQRFLPTAEFQVALAYLEQRGLTILSSSLDSIITAQGTASQVSQSMGLSLELYSNGTSSYYSASGVSQIPGAYVYSSNVTAVLLRHPPDLVTGATVSALDARASQTNQTVPIEAYPLKDLQSVYNATSLYAKGNTGAGYTAGVLDFYGDPYITQQLQYFDQLYDQPSARLNVIPIDAYNPSLGTVEGWADEISLDVESVHTMAPGATIDLYIGNGALALSTAIAAIVSQDKVSDLSQSFGLPEATLSSLGASAFEMNVVLADQYYMLGSAEGITFVSSTGDLGGSGAAGGPEGSVAYPSTSPYVVAVGGTTTYLTFDGPRVSSSYQTAWSNYGFVPHGANYGGGTGGVSDLEPRPWYQSSLTAPAGFPSGREVPDLSLNANVYPGVFIVVPGNLTAISGGTSESSPLLAGLLTLLMGASKSELGLINPSLYSLAQDPSLYSKVYHPITFGYIIPWVSQSGYNMATGWGAPNIGEMAYYGLGAVSSKDLSVNVTLTENGTQPVDVLSGAVLSISAEIKNGASTVSTGSFVAELDTLTGALMNVPLAFDTPSSSWKGHFTSPENASGLAFVTVKGSSGGTSGTGSVGVFTGYLAQFFSPSEDEPYSAQFGTQLAVNITTLSGAPPTASTFSFSASSYSLASNTYTKVATVPLSDIGSVGIWSGTLTGTYPDGPMVFSGNDGVYGYLPIFNGVDMQASFIETSVLVEPGVVAPGQSIFTFATLAPPLNMPDKISTETGLPVSFDVQLGSNVTVSLVSQSGNTVASETIYENSFLSSSQGIQGALTVPLGTPSGLYNVILKSSYDSFTLGTSINGSYFGQVYVAPSESKLGISISPSMLFEGQTVSFSAKIDYANGSSVKYGMYSAALYPKDLQNSYSALTNTIQVPLWYDVATGLWSGNLTLPSAYNSGGTVTIDPGALYLNGPYEIYVSGLSADGVPSSTDISTQQGLTIQPYLYLSGRDLTSLPQTSQVAFVNDTITGSAALTSDLFIGSNTIEGGTFTISSSQINGTLYVNNAQVTLTGVSGGAVVSHNSKLVVLQSDLSSLQLNNSQVSSNDSAFQRLTPSIPTISVQSPAQGQDYNGTSGSLTVTGQQIDSVSVYLDGAMIMTLQGGSSSYTFPLDSGSLSLGVHTLKVVATQTDGMSASTTVSFSAEGRLVVVNNSISSLTSQVSSANSTIGGLNSRLSSDQNTISSLMGTVRTLTYGLYGLGVAAVLALVLAIVALSRRDRRRADANSAATYVPQ